MKRCTSIRIGEGIDGKRVEVEASKHIFMCASVLWDRLLDPPDHGYDFLLGEEVHFLQYLAGVHHHLLAFFILSNQCTQVLALHTMLRLLELHLDT